MSIKITELNYETYKRVFEIFSRQLFKGLTEFLPSSTGPISVLDEWEIKSKSLARKGLQAGLNDILSNLKHWPKTTLEEISSDLLKENLPNLDTLMKIADKTISKVISAKKIKNIDEYYIIKELLDDTNSEISEVDRNNLSIYFFDFESKAGKTQKR